MLTNHVYHIIAVGKHKGLAIEKAIEEYSANLNKFCNIKWHICQESKYTQNNIRNAVNEESLHIKKIIGQIKSPYVICLSEGPKCLPSVQMAVQLKKWMDINVKLAFIIGGAYGLGDEIKKIANANLSLSNLTFNHLLVRLVLLEQLYRCLSINYSTGYHH